MRQETFKYWDLVHIILEVWQFVSVISFWSTHWNTQPPQSTPITVTQCEQQITYFTADLHRHNSPLLSNSSHLINHQSRNFCHIDLRRSYPTWPQYDWVTGGLRSVTANNKVSLYVGQVTHQLWWHIMEYTIGLSLICYAVSVNSLASERSGYYFKNTFCNLVMLVSSDLLMIVPSDECHRTLLMISQH